MTPRDGDEPLFAAVLRDTLAAVDAAPADDSAPTSQPSVSRRQLARFGVVVTPRAVALFALSHSTGPTARAIDAGRSPFTVR